MSGLIKFKWIVVYFKFYLANSAKFPRTLAKHYTRWPAPPHQNTPACRVPHLFQSHRPADGRFTLSWSTDFDDDERRPAGEEHSGLLAGSA